MDLPCCKSFKLATLSLKRDLLATQHLIKSFANNDENIPYFTTIFVILIQTFYFFTFFCENTSLTVFTESQQKSYPFEHFFSQVGYMANIWLHPTKLFGEILTILCQN